MKVTVAILISCAVAAGPDSRSECLNGSFGDFCQRKATLLCKERSISIEMDDDLQNNSHSSSRFGSIAYVGRRRKWSIQPELETPVHDAAGPECRFNHIIRNGKQFIDIAEEYYELCGISPAVNQDTVQFSGLVWQNIDSGVLSQPRILFDFMCNYTITGHTSGFTEQPLVTEISHDTTPTIIGSHHQTLPIRLYYSPPGLASRREIFGGFPRSPSMISEWVFATVDLSEAHVAKYFDVALDDCFVRASGDELNIQIIDAGRPVFSFVKMHERSHNALNFSMRVFKLRQQYDNADVYLVCTLKAK